jgi:hypothetical protein
MSSFETDNFERQLPFTAGPSCERSFWIWLLFYDLQRFFEIYAGLHCDWIPEPSPAATRAGRMVLSTAIHLLGWLCKGIGNWIAYRRPGSDIDFMRALAMEALLHALLIPAFVVPGYAGVQEAGYAGIGALFGIPPEISRRVSLLRRARDIAIGTPTLLAWQLVEMRR